MRLFLIPISTRRAFIYCQQLRQQPAAEVGYLQISVNKVQQKWAEWERSTTRWKQLLTNYGNEGLQRVAYEEWALKSFPPLTEQSQALALSKGKKVELVYPENIIQSSDIPKIVRRLADERKQLHWRRFAGSMLGIPFTLPLGLIPM